MCVRCVWGTLWGKVATPSKINICAYVLTLYAPHTHTHICQHVAKIYVCARMYVHNLVNLKLMLYASRRRRKYMHTHTHMYISNVKELDFVPFFHAI